MRVTSEEKTEREGVRVKIRPCRRIAVDEAARLQGSEVLRFETLTVENLDHVVQVFHKQ